MTPQPSEIVASGFASSSVIPITPTALSNILSICSFSDLSSINVSEALECIVEHGRPALAPSIPPWKFFAHRITFDAENVVFYQILLTAGCLTLILLIVSACKREREGKEIREVRGREMESKNLWLV